RSSGRGPRSARLSRCVGHPRTAVLAHRSVTHVRHYRGAEQEYRERQRNQVPPHAALPFPHPAVVYDCRLSRPYDCPRVKVRDQGAPKKEWGEGTRTDSDVWKYIRPIRSSVANEG